jgi:hypothetical protein
MQNTYERLLSKFPQIDFMGIRIYSCEIARIHRKEGVLKMEFLSGCNNTNVTIGVIWEALRYSFVLSVVYVDHLRGKT